MTKFVRSLSEEDEEDHYTQEWGERVVKKRPLCRPQLHRWYLLVLGILLLVVISLGIVQLIYHLAQAPELLVPPNPEVPQPPSNSIEHVFKKAAVCSDGAPCSGVGRDILARNGSVVDAAVATMFCNGIVNCQSMGLGGGFLMTLYLQDSKTAITLNAREAAPLGATERMFVDNPKLAQAGALAVGVPGELKGYWEAHQRYGRLPWSEVVAPALNICRNGYNMTKHQADSLTFSPSSIHNDPTLRDVFVDPKTGSFLKQGSVVKHKKLCETLRIISEKGNDLYNGTLAKMLAEDIREMGGIITEQDLKNYKVKWEKPITVDLGNAKLYSVPPPGSGLILGFILNILKGYHFTNDSVSSINSTILTYHRIVEAFKFAFAKRTELGDPDFVDVEELVSKLTSSTYAEKIRSQIMDNETFLDPKSYGAVSYNQEDHGTAHISVIAPNGDAASITSTVNLYFGAGIASKQTGIILNSGMDDFSSPNFDSYFGLPGSPSNSIQPGKRSVSSMCPSIVVDKNGMVKLVVGASGGTKITTATAQVIMRHLWFGEGIKQAVDASRFHHQLNPMHISYEYGVLDQVVRGLERLGHKTSRYKDRGSIICAVAKKGNIIYANADYRKGGEVFGIN